MKLLRTIFSILKGPRALWTGMRFRLRRERLERAAEAVAESERLDRLRHPERYAGR